MFHIRLKMGSVGLLPREVDHNLNPLAYFINAGRGQERMTDIAPPTGINTIDSEVLQVCAEPLKDMLDPHIHSGSSDLDQ